MRDSECAALAAAADNMGSYDEEEGGEEGGKYMPSSPIAAFSSASTPGAHGTLLVKQTHHRPT